MNKKNLWQHLKDALLGGQAVPTDAVNIQGVDTTSPEYKENMAGAAADITVSQNPRVGGLIPDIRAGYRENAYNPLKVENLGQDFSADGRKKGAGYRFGEFAGTAARLLDNPLVRGGIAYGLSKSMGDRRPLVEGLTAAVGTQQNRMKDSIYRNSLIEQGQNSLRNTAGFANLDPAEQQAQLDRIADQVNSYRGYLGDDTYKQVLAGMQLRDNAEYRNALLKGQRLEQDALLAQKQAELQHKKMSEAADRALKSRELDIKEYQALNEGKETQNNEQKLNEMQAQLDDFVSTFDLVDNPYRYRIAGGVSNVLNTLTPEEANFNAKRTLLFNAIARKLADEKGVLSDQDIKRIDDALPKLADTKKQKMAKMGATYSLLDIRRGYKTPQAQTGNTTKSGVKYEVID